MKKNIIFLFFIFFSYICFSENYLINTSHIEEITAMEYCDERQLLFSGSKDGIIKIWDIWSKELLYSLIISHMPIVDIAVHPTEPYIAILEDYGTNSTSIKVWDWEKNIELYSIDTENTPIDMNFSSLGTYLYYCVPDWDSLKFHNPENGSQVNIIKYSSGIISFMIFSRTEKNLMTYKPSGEISFMDISANEIILKVNTIANLSNINISGDRNYLIGSSGNIVYLIDILTGNVLDSMEIENVSDISIKDYNVLCNSKSGSIENILFLKIIGKKFNYINDPLLQFSNEEITTAVMGNATVFLGDSNGNISTVNYYGVQNTFAKNNLLNISGIDIKNDIIAIGSSQGILIIRLDISNILYGGSEIINSGAVSNIIRNPFPESIGLSFIDNTDKIMIWDKSDNNGIAVLDTKNNSIQKENINFNSPIIQLSYFQDNVIVLDKLGNIQMYSMPDFNKVYNYFSPGMNKILTISDKSLIGVQTNQSQNTGSLLHINPINGETFSIPGKSLYSYDCIYDPVHNRLFSISVEKNRNNSIITAIKRHYGQDYENEEIIKQYSGEDFSASIAYEPVENRLYTSLGFDSIQVWDPSGIYKSTFETSEHVPRNILISENLLISYNLDSSITVWNRKTQKILFDFYLFNDFNWIAINSNSEVNFSPGAEKYLIEN